MKKHLLLIVATVGFAAGCLLLAGCQTPGRVTVAEINSLTAEQMRALAGSDALVYQSDTAVAGAAAPVKEERAGIPWIDAIKAFFEAKWRVTVIKVEWGRPVPTPSPDVSTPVVEGSK